MANCSEKDCQNLVSKLRNISGTEITSLLYHFDSSPDRNSSKYFKNFKFFRTWLTDEYTTYAQDFSTHEAIESYLQIREIQNKLLEFEISLIKKMNGIGQFSCSECGNQLKLSPQETLLCTLQKHQLECTKCDNLTASENNGDGELVLKLQASSSSSAGTSTSTSVHEASTSQSEKDFDESGVNATQENWTKYKDQMLQLPDDNLNTWCTECAEKVPYSAVEQHLSQKIHELPSQLEGDASKRIVNYDDSVLKALYSDKLNDYTLHISSTEFFVIQNLGAFKHCLVCVENITNVASHVNSRAHNTLANKGSVQKILKRYHDTWVCQPLSTQIQQKYFRKHHIGMICVMCRTVVPYNAYALRLHLESSQHRLFVLKCVALNDEEFDYSVRNFKPDTNSIAKALPDCIIDIINKPEHEMYPPVIMAYVYARDQSKLYTVQLKSNRSLRCLLCQIEFTFKEISQLLKHVQIKKHKNRATNTGGNLYVALNSYHNFWKGINRKDSFVQEEFWPVTNTITWCIKCGINLEYKHVHKHIQKYHINNAKDGDMLKLIHKDYKFTPCIYKTKILELMYPDDIAQFNIIKDMMNYPLIQTLQNIKMCTLCRVLFNVDALEHLTSQKHIKNANDPTSLREFTNYHKNWVKKTLSPIQKEQVYFFPKKNKLECILCACTIHQEDVTSHIQTKEHKAHASTALSAYLRVADANSVNKNNILLKAAYVNKQLCAEIKGSSSANESNASNGKTGIINSYDPIVESILYPKLFNKLSRELSNNNTLTIRFQENTSFLCLLCCQTEVFPKFLLEREVRDHITGPKHIKKYTNDLMMSTLDIYHKQWTRIPLQSQMSQVDFIPVNNNKCRCFKCQCLLDYSELGYHLKIKKHFHPLSNQGKFSSLMTIDSADLENRLVSPNAERVNLNSVVNETSLHDNINENANVFELNEMSQSDSMSSSDVYEVDDTEDESESDSVVSFRDTTKSDPSEFNDYQSDSSELLNQQLKQDDHFPVNFTMKYDKTVEETLYPDLQMGCVEIDGVKYPVFRIVENEGVVCAVCKGSPMVQSIANHQESKAKHIKRINDVNVLLRLKRFHLFWMSQEAPSQLLQRYFKTTESDCHLKCCLCQVVVLYENCIEHVKYFHNVQNFDKEDKMFSLQVGNENSESSSLSPTTVAGFCDNISDKYKAPDFNFQFKFEMKYDKSVESILYPGELRKHFMLIDNIEYPIFRVKAGGFECLICNNNSDTAFTSIKNHLDSSAHICESQKQFTLTRLVGFHNFWMNQEPNLQLQQMHFGIQDIKLKCVLCDSTVTYEKVTTHVELPEHKKSADLNKLESTKTPSISKRNLNQLNTLKASPKPTAKVSPTCKKKQKHEIRKAISTPNSSVLLERMPERYKSHLHFFKTDSKGSVFCHCCSTTLPNELIALKSHLKTKDHINISKTPLLKYKFFCEICMKIYSSEESWEKHLEENGHSKLLNNLGVGRKGNILEYECVTCALVIFGDELSLKRHQQWNKLASKKKKELKLPENVKTLFKSNENIEYVANQLVAQANHESQNQEKEKNCCLTLVNTLKEMYPQCRAYPFGSRVIGLGSKDSDLDIFVDVDGMYTGSKLQSAEEQAVIVMEVKKILRKSKSIFSHINPVPTARTPIIQVFHVPTGIDCDVSFRHGLSVENTAFIRLCIDLQPVIQGVVLILKQWCRMCDLNNFSSYALTMMAIFYFQTQGYLLTIKDLREINFSEPVTINGWKTIKYTASLSTMKGHLKSCSLSVKDLLHDFFKYFASYDYDKQVMCPLLGQSVLKTCFNKNGSTLPPEMESYIQKVMHPDAELFRHRSPMCIQDPFDFSHNLTKACEKSFLTKWRGYCELSAKHLSALQ